MQAGLGQHRLSIARVESEADGKIWEGILTCENAGCRSEFPIIDGMPILLPNLRSYVADNIFQIMARDDLAAATSSLLGDCCSQNSHLDVTRQHLSCYAWDHYGEFDPTDRLTEPSDVPKEKQPMPQRPGSMARAVRMGLEQSSFCQMPAGPLLDAGCSVGRSAFELAALTSRDVLAIDLNYSMLRLASTILRTGEVKYAKRRGGLVYDAKRFPVAFENSSRVDFWICDAQALPFAEQSFAAAVAMNLLDSVPSPAQLIRSFASALKPGGQLLLASPYDWSAAVTPVEAWLGGHSQRNEHAGATAPVIEFLLSQAGFQIQTEWPEVGWTVRMHERSSMAYGLHMVQCSRLGA